MREKYGNIYITTCEIDGKWEFAMWNRELNSVLHGNLEGWVGVGDGGLVQKGRDICIPVVYSC